MKKTVKFTTAIIQFLALALTVAVVFDVQWLQTMFGIGTGPFAFAFAAIAGGTVTEENYPETLLERDVDDIVVEYKPDRFPLTTMMQNQKSAKAAMARKYEWVEVGYHARSTVTTAATLAGSGGSAVSVPVQDVNMWGVGDLVYVPGVTTGTPAVELRGYVQNVDNTAVAIDVLPVNATNLPAIPSGESLIRLSRAAASDDAQTASHGAQGVELWNYCQTFMGQFEIEKILRKIRRYMNDEQVQEDLEMFDFRNTRENARLFGPRAKFYDPIKKKYVYTMGGVETFAGQADTYTQGTISNSQWIDITKKMFKGNAGSEQRLVVAGSEFIASVLKVPSVEKQQEPENIELVLGAKVNKIATNFGEVLLKWHKGFDEAGREHDAFGLDMNHICDRVLEPMQETELSLDKTGVRRVDATRLLETATLQVRYPDTHTIIKGI